MNYSTFTTPELAARFWAFYNEVHGVNPHWVKPTDRATILGGLEILEDHVKWLNRTSEGVV